MLTQKDIAKKLNISQQAVSASLSSTTSVKVGQQTKQRVIEVAREMGYMPNFLAKSLRTGKTSTFGVIMPYTNDPYYAALIDALSMEALQQKYSLLLQFHLWSAEEEEAAFRRLVQAKVEGIFFYTRMVDYRANSLIQDIRKKGVRVIATHSQHFDLDVFDGVIAKDHVQDGYLLGTELIRQGHRSIDLLAIEKDHIIQRSKMEGILKAIAQSSVPAYVQDVNIPSSEYSIINPKAPASIFERDATLQRLVSYYLEYKKRGTAVIVGNEIVAAKLINAAKSINLDVPKDFSVVCSGIVGQGENGPLSLTSAEYDPLLIAKGAIDLLLNGDKSLVKISPRLVRRMSASNPPLLEALTV